MTEMTVRRSTEINELAAALAKAQGDFATVEKKRKARVKGQTKDGRPYDYTFLYADLGDVLNVALPILSKHGIAFTQPTVVEGGVIYIRTTLMHSSGQWQESDYPVANFGDKKHQQIGEALTFAKRYAGCAVLGIAPEETVEETDMGGDTEVGRPERQRMPKPKPEVIQGTDQKPLPPLIGEPYIAADGQEVPPDKDLRTHYKEQAKKQKEPSAGNGAIDKQITLMVAKDGSHSSFPSTAAGGIAAIHALQAMLEDDPNNWAVNSPVARRLLEIIPSVQVGEETVSQIVTRWIQEYEGPMP